MTTRPSFASNKSRPLSAIFLGSGPSPSNKLPDLPEPPPSPGAASNSSGLPSPPATNSTGSGSTGDDTANYGSVRQRPASYSHSPNLNTNLLNGNYENNNRSTTNIKEDEEDEDNDHDNDNDEDSTARLDRRRSLKGTSENIEALQRVKSLTQRNRMALDKLSSISRLSSPSHSPSPANRSSRSPAPSQSAGSSSATSSHSRLSHNHSHAHSVSLSHPLPHYPHAHSHSQSNNSSHANMQYREDLEQVLSGSETEREGHLNHRMSLASLAHSSTSSEDQSISPPSSVATSNAPLRMASTTGMIPPSPRHRPRRTSLPNSPGSKAVNLTRSRSGRDGDHRDASPGPSKAPKKRPGTVTSSIPDSSPDYNDYPNDLTSAALAAVARSRTPISVSVNGGGSSKGKRAALPREFMGRDRRSLDGRSTGSSEPQTPHRQPNRENTNVYLARGSPSPKSTASTFGQPNQPPPQSPRGPRGGRSSTVRELTRRHQTRWLSEDMSGDLDDGDIPGRRQNQRGGSAESPLTSLAGGRSLVGEGLRAAGIMTKRGDDIFGNGGSIRGTDEQSQASGSGGSRVSEGAGPPSASSAKVSFDSRPNEASERRAHRGSYNGIASRPATSMADYYHHGEDIEPPRTAPLPDFGAYNSPDAFPDRDRDRDRQGIGSSIHARQNPPPSQPTPPLDRPFISPFTTRRHTAMTPLPPGSGSTPAPGHQFSTSEHGRLMLEALQMFESHLSRLPPMGNTTTQTIPDLFRSAQNIVHASDKLNGLLRAGTNGALEEQIDAEVGNNDGAAGGEEVAEVWRRVGGELRESLRISDEVVRTMTGFLLGVGKVLKETAVASGDGLQQHARSISLDEESVGQRNGASPDVGYTNGSGGRRSTEGRMSAQSRRSWEPSPRHQADSSGSKRLSARAEARPPSVLNTHRDTDVSVDGTVRRLFTPREHREQKLDANTSLDSSNGYEPSPTPGSRQNHAALARARTLPPPPLPSLPSESSLRRGGSFAVGGTNRRKPSVTSIQTIRGTNPLHPSDPTPTTAISKDDGGPFPITRNDSNGSSRTTNVTFSRPSTISVSTLSGLHQQRKRTISTTSSNAEEVSTSVQQVISPLSGSETERDTRRSTVGARAAARMSLDGALHRDRDVGNRDGRGQPPVSIAAPTLRRERRRTVTEIFR